MNPSRLSALALPAGLVLLAGMACLAAGCDESRPSHVREERIASALPLSPQKSLRVETRTADVHFVPSPDDTVRVLTVKRVQSMSERSVEALWKQIRVTVERAGDELVLRVREPERGTSHVTVQAGPWRLRRRVEIEVTIAVPAGKAVTFVTEKGDVDAHDLKNSVHMELASGDAELTDLEGGDLYVQSTSGDVTVQRVRQPVTVRTTAGDVDATDLSGPVTVRATSGDVAIHRVRGRIAVETSTGDAEVMDGDGNVFVSTSAGDATVHARVDSLVIETSSGDQDVTLAGPPQSVALKSSSGGVDLALPKATGGALDVQTATGAMSIQNAVRIGTMTRNHFAGDLGGGGRTQIRTSSGDVTLKAAPIEATAAAEAAQGGSK